MVGAEEKEFDGSASLVDSAETVAQIRSYARAVDPTAGQTSAQIARSTSELCPYYLMGLCRYGEECTYIHGELCELCGQPCLHPTDEAQRLKHNEVSVFFLFNFCVTAGHFLIYIMYMFRSVCASTRLTWKNRLR